MLEENLQNPTREQWSEALAARKKGGRPALVELIRRNREALEASEIKSTETKPEPSTSNPNTSHEKNSR